MINNIEITKLHPHYDNPRKDLGDLTELSESIKAKGILQNLTVVPWFSKITGVGADDPKQQDQLGYIVVIGHRRFAAAKLAGLEEVPCVISDMSYRDQIETMLLENMQRNDLTIWEQAQGFQMMLDLGESIAEISERTGFSETTVKRRMNLLKLDADKFKKSMERGATLMDYVELEKIHDNKLRNSVLDKIGTSNFKWELQQAIDKEKNEKNVALIVAELEKFAKQVKDTNGLQYIKGFYGSQNLEIIVPDDAYTAEYFFQISNYGSVNLYKKSEVSKASIVQDNKQKEIQEQRTALQEISKWAYQLRKEYIFELSNAQAKKATNTIIEYSVMVMASDDYYSNSLEDFATALGYKVEEDDEWSFDKIREHVAAQPERHLLISTYLALDSEREHYFNWNNQHYDNEMLNTTYSFLERLGYEMSDEERAMREGTHKLFQINN